MFTGLIEDIGTLDGLERHGRSASLRVRTGLPVTEIAIGDSVAVNGACLTVEAKHGQVLQCHCLEETLSRTNLGTCTRGAHLNLERAALVGGRLGGHFVTGHVDCCVKVLFAGHRGEDYALTVSVPPEHRPCVVPKGSVTLNGVSLTVAELDDASLTVFLIPHTGAATNLTELTPGAPVNLETDILGKYVVQSLRLNQSPGEITMEKLAENGFL
ncbi:MAG: riboflavin synthase [Victivallales bacterium]|nr:riboflavin synthase [Victivallales bacterium]